jgi:hypothetical protein
MTALSSGLMQMMALQALIKLQADTLKYETPK